jgi:alkanesulfonate monooxygenase SsuD/methylene tetrahydromethanopterin reductase-like flavin-dependent oxidoreductase (luciferase family)
VQPGGPPVIVGGMSPQAMDRALDYADGWLPIDGGMGPDALKPMLDEFDRRREAKGRARDAVSLTVYGATPNPAVLAKYREMGVDRVTLRMRPEARDAVLPKLDKLAALVA